MTLCIAHLDYVSTIVVIDALREARPTSSLEIVASEFVALLKSYHLVNPVADRWGGDWVKEQFAKFGIMIKTTSTTNHGLYVDLLATINSRRVDLLEHQRCFTRLSHWSGAAVVVRRPSTILPVDMTISSTQSPVASARQRSPPVAAEIIRGRELCGIDGSGGTASWFRLVAGARSGYGMSSVGETMSA